jgi:hypothetical protein
MLEGRLHGMQDARDSCGPVLRAATDFQVLFVSFFNRGIFARHVELPFCNTTGLDGALMCFYAHYLDVYYGPTS